MGGIKPAKIIAPKDKWTCNRLHREHKYLRDLTLSSERNTTFKAQFYMLYFCSVCCSSVSGPFWLNSDSYCSRPILKLCIICAMLTRLQKHVFANFKTQKIHIFKKFTYSSKHIHRMLPNQQQVLLHKFLISPLTWFSYVWDGNPLLMSHEPQHRKDSKSSYHTGATVQCT